jgi:hypothetical protein
MFIVLKFICQFYVSLIKVFNVTNCSNRYFNFHFDKSLLCRIRRYIVHSWIKTKQLKKVADIITFFHNVKKSDTS